MVPVSLDGVDVTGADLADLAGDAGRIERPSGTWELEKQARRHRRRAPDARRSRVMRVARVYIST